MKPPKGTLRVDPLKLPAEIMDIRFGCLCSLQGCMRVLGVKRVIKFES